MFYIVFGFFLELYKIFIREMVLWDFLICKFDRMVYEVSGRCGIGKSGMIVIIKMG